MRVLWVTVTVTVLSPSEVHFTVISLVSLPLMIEPPSTVQLHESPDPPAVSRMVITVSVRDVAEVIQTVSLLATPPTSVTIIGTMVSVTLKVTVIFFVSHAGDWLLMALTV